MIFDAIQSSSITDQATVHDTDQATVHDVVEISVHVQRLISVMENREYNLTELMQLVGLSHRATFQKNSLNPAIEAGLVKRIIPDKPESPKQRYRLKKYFITSFLISLDMNSI